MDANDNIYRSKFLHLTEFFLQGVFFHIHTIVRLNGHIVKKFIENFRIDEVFDAVSEKLAEHPLLKFLVFFTALSCAIPVVMFLAFGIISVVIAFIGFIFIEGTLLAVGGLCMLVCIISMILVLSMLGLAVGIFYILTLKLGNVLNKLDLQTSSSILKTVSPLLPESHVAEVPNVIANHYQD